MNHIPLESCRDGECVVGPYVVSEPDASGCDETNDCLYTSSWSSHRRAAAIPRRLARRVMSLTDVTGMASLTTSTFVTRSETLKFPTATASSEAGPRIRSHTAFVRGFKVESERCTSSLMLKAPFRWESGTGTETNGAWERIANQLSIDCFTYDSAGVTGKPASDGDIAGGEALEIFEIVGSIDCFTLDRAKTNWRLSFEIARSKDCFVLDLAWATWRSIPGPVLARIETWESFRIPTSIDCFTLDRAGTTSKSIPGSGVAGRGIESGPGTSSRMAANFALTAATIFSLDGTSTESTNVVTLETADALIDEASRGIVSGTSSPHTEPIESNRTRPFRSADASIHGDGEMNPHSLRSRLNCVQSDERVEMRGKEVMATGEAVPAAPTVHRLALLLSG
jgi:hypothetical protein